MTAHKQGRVAGGNAVGNPARFRGSLGTQVVKVFDDLSYTPPLGSPWDGTPCSSPPKPRKPVTVTPCPSRPG